MALLRYCPGTCLMELKKITFRVVDVPPEIRNEHLQIQVYSFTTASTRSIYILPHLFCILLLSPLSFIFIFSTSFSHLPSTSFSAQLRIRTPRDPINYVRVRKRIELRLMLAQKPFLKGKMLMRTEQVFFKPKNWVKYITVQLS